MPSLAARREPSVIQIKRPQKGITPSMAFTEKKTGQSQEAVNVPPGQPSDGLVHCVLALVALNVGE